MMRPERGDLPPSEHRLSAPWRDLPISFRPPNSKTSVFSLPFYLVGLVLGLADLLGALACYWSFSHYIDTSPNIMHDGEGFYRLPIVLAILPCLILDWLLKSLASGYFILLNLRAKQNLLERRRYKLPFLLTGLCLLVIVILSGSALLVFIFHI